MKEYAMKLHTVLRDVTLIIVVLACALLSLGGEATCRQDATPGPGRSGDTPAASERRTDLESAFGGQLGKRSRDLGGQLG